MRHVVRYTLSVVRIRKRARSCVNLTRETRALGNGEYPCKLNCADVGVKLKRTGNRFLRTRDGYVEIYVRTHRDALTRCSGSAKAWNTKSACAEIYNRNKFQRSEKRDISDYRISCSHAMREKISWKFVSKYMKIVIEGNAAGDTCGPCTRVCYRFVYFRFVEQI